MSVRRGPRRVLYCESNVDGTIGGSHYCLLNLVEWLDRSRYEPVTLFYQQHALIPRFEAVSETVVWPPHDPWRPATGPAAAAPLAMLRRGVNFLKLAALVRREARWLREHDIALVHLNNSVTRHHDWMLAALVSGVPCITHERGLNDRYSGLDRFLARRLDLIIPMSRWIQDHMVARGVAPDNIRVLYDGLDPTRLKVTRRADALRHEWNVGPNQPIIGIVGNVRVWKGQEVVIRALVEIARARPDVVCFVVGSATPEDQPYVDALQAIIREAGVEANVRFTGYQDRVPDFVNMMSVVIHASIKPEPFGMVVLEGMAMGKPVIGSAAGGVVEMVVPGVTGYTFPPGDAQALAARVVELLNDPARAAAMGQAGYRRVVEDFPLDRYARQVEACYDEILDRRAPAMTRPA